MQFFFLLFNRVVGYFFCIDIDECESFPCQNGGTCTDSIAGYTCDCVPGHTGEDCETSVPICIILFV